MPHFPLSMHVADWPREHFSDEIQFALKFKSHFLSHESNQLHLLLLLPLLVCYFLPEREMLMMALTILPHCMQCAIPIPNKKAVHFISMVVSFGERATCRRKVRQANGHKGRPNVTNKTILFKAIKMAVNLNVNGRIRVHIFPPPRKRAAILTRDDFRVIPTVPPPQHSAVGAVCVCTRSVHVPGHLS